MKPKRQQYPYTIQPIPLGGVPLKKVAKSALADSKLNPLQVEEFFRIEALLRSMEMMDLYRKHKAEADREVLAYRKAKGYVSFVMGNLLWKRFDIPDGWTILAGAHHRLILKEWLIVPSGITDLREFRPDLREKDPKAWIDHLLDNPSRFLLLALDLSQPAKALLNRLYPILIKRHMKTKKPRQYDVQVWANYFKCYDLHVDQELTYRDIAAEVYPNQSEDSVAKAVKAVRVLIAQTEKTDAGK